MTTRITKKTWSVELVYCVMVLTIQCNVERDVGEFQKHISFLLYVICSTKTLCTFISFSTCLLCSIYLYYILLLLFDKKCILHVWIFLFQSCRERILFFTRNTKRGNITSEVEIIWGLISWSIFLFLMAIHFPMYVWSWL